MKDHLIVAIFDDYLVGLLWAKIDPTCGNKANLYQMWTDPDHHGKGLGRALILKAISWLKEHDVKEVYLSVTLRDSPAMRL